MTRKWFPKIKSWLVNKKDFLPWLGWYLMLLITPFFVDLFFKAKLDHLIIFVFWILFSIIYGIAVSQRIRELAKTYGGIATVISLFIGLGIFFINLQRENDNLLDKNRRIKAILKEDNNHNYKLMEVILNGPGDPKTSILLDFRTKNYLNNWDFIVFTYTQDCMNEYADAIVAMEASNNLIMLGRVSNQQHQNQLEHLASEKIKKSFDEIFKNKCQ